MSNDKYYIRVGKRNTYYIIIKIKYIKIIKYQVNKKMQFQNAAWIGI